MREKKVSPEQQEVSLGLCLGKNYFWVTKKGCKGSLFKKSLALAQLIFVK
jgi:hypothetical protein